MIAYEYQDHTRVDWQFQYVYVSYAVLSSRAGKVIQ
jgi:hypothetical protein